MSSKSIIQTKGRHQRVLDRGGNAVACAICDEVADANTMYYCTQEDEAALPGGETLGSDYICADCAGDGDE